MKCLKYGDYKDKILEFLLNISYSHKQMVCDLIIVKIVKYETKLTQKILMHQLWK